MSAANILVVDDEPQIRRVLRSTLSTQGYVIMEAKTGEEALEWMRKERPDLVLLDIHMPGMGGIEACREIRRASDMPIIMLTVRNAERAASKRARAGTIVMPNSRRIEHLLDPLLGRMSTPGEFQGLA